MDRTCSSQWTALRSTRVPKPFAVIFDLDQTLVDSTAALALRRQRRWPQVYGLIPQFSLYENISDVLALVEELRLRTAIVTASPSSYATRVLDHFGIRCDVKVCYHDTSLHKPNPAPISLALERLELNARQVISVGDDAKDIVASKRASVLSVAAAWGSDSIESLRDASPDHWCDTPADLIDFLTSATQDA